jgi:hypothetical protein
MRSNQQMSEEEAIVAVARRYRDAMRRYMREQADLAAHGAGLDALVTTNWEEFAAVTALEEELFARLDTFDAVRS